MNSTSASRTTNWLGLSLIALACVIGLAFVMTRAGAPDAVRSTPMSAAPRIDHFTLPVHRSWQVVSVQPYEGLEEVELVKFNWPTAQDARLAFALTKEGLSVGDQVCLDHIRDIDAFWAHPVPEGGCASRPPLSGVRR